MLLDALLKFSDAQAVTAAAASTSSINLGAARNIGTGKPLYVVLTVDVGLTDSGSDSTVAVTLEGDSTSTFSPDGSVALFTIPALTAAGTVFIAALSPGAAALNYQYVQLRYTPGGGDLTTGSFTAYLTENVDQWTAYAKNYTITA